MITANGTNIINQYLARATPEWAGTIAIGLLSSSATSSATTYLQYEFSRTPITLKTFRTVSGSNQQALKATLDPSLAFNAYEIGIYPARLDAQSNTDIFPISDFSEISSGSSAWLVSGVPATVTQANPAPRAGAYNLTLATGTTATTPVSFVTVAYSSSDFIDALYYAPASVSSGSLTVLFADSAVPANVWAASTTFTAPTGSTYYTSRLTLGTKPAAFTDNLSSVSVTYQGSGSLVFDHTKFYTGNTKPAEYQLVSRTISSASTVPLITKTTGQAMDIEYYIQVP